MPAAFAYGGVAGRGRNAPLGWCTEPQSQDGHGPTSWQRPHATSNPCNSDVNSSASLVFTDTRLTARRSSGGLRERSGRLDGRDDREEQQIRRDSALPQVKESLGIKLLIEGRGLESLRARRNSSSIVRS